MSLLVGYDTTQVEVDINRSMNLYQEIACPSHPPTHMHFQSPARTLRVVDLPSGSTG